MPLPAYKTLLSFMKTVWHSGESPGSGHGLPSTDVSPRVSPLTSGPYLLRMKNETPLAMNFPYTVKETTLNIPQIMVPLLYHQILLWATPLDWCSILILS